MPADQQLPVPQPGSSVEISWQPMRPLLVPEEAMVDP